MDPRDKYFGQVPNYGLNNDKKIHFLNILQFINYHVETGLHTH